MCFHDIFDSWDAAVAYQRIGLMHCLDKGWPIRACEIRDEKDFRTGKQVFIVFVRPFVVVRNVAP